MDITLPRYFYNDFYPRIQVRLRGSNDPDVLAHFPQPAFSSLIQAAINYSISRSESHVPLPAVLYIDVKVHDTRYDDDGSLENDPREARNQPAPFTLPNEPTRLPVCVYGDRESVSRDHNYKLLIDYEMAFHDLRTCCQNLREGASLKHIIGEDALQDADSAQYDPITRSLLLSRYLLHYVRLRLRDDGWMRIRDPIPFDIATCRKYIRAVVNQGSPSSLERLHKMLTPELTRFLGLPVGNPYDDYPGEGREDNQDNPAG